MIANSNSVRPWMTLSPGRLLATEALKMLGCCPNLKLGNVMLTVVTLTVPVFR